MRPPLNSLSSPRGAHPLTLPRTARNSRPLEVIGTYDPIPKKDPYDTTGRLHKDIKLDTTRAKYWIGVGAHPTETVWRLLSMVGTRQLYTLRDCGMLTCRLLGRHPPAQTPTRGAEHHRAQRPIE